MAIKMLSVSVLKLLTSKVVLSVALIRPSNCCDIQVKATMMPRAMGNHASFKATLLGMGGKRQLGRCADKSTRPIPVTKPPRYKANTDLDTKLDRSGARLPFQ